MPGINCINPMHLVWKSHSYCHHFGYWKRKAYIWYLSEVRFVWSSYFRRLLFLLPSKPPLQTEIMTHQFQHCILKLSFSSYLFIKHEHFFADKAWLSSLLALPNLFCFFQVLVFLLRVSSYKNFKRISNGATVVSHSYMLQVYVLYSPLHKIKQQAEETSLFFIFPLFPLAPLLS